MKRLIIVYNPGSSRYKDVRKEILDIFTKPSEMRKIGFDGVMVGKYEIEKTDVDDNAKKIAKVLCDGDVILAVGGDATAAVAVNGILMSKKDIELAVLPYGNFNDLARTLKTMKLKDFLNANSKKMWPLEILVDGKHFRYASCYVTIGMTAASVELFDDKKVRKELRKGHKSSWRSYIQLAKWYFKNRHKKNFLPEFELNGIQMHRKTTDYAAINGRSMCRVMKGGDWYLKEDIFRSETGKLANFWNLFVLMAKSILAKVPGDETSGDVLNFLQPATVEIQAEGEYKVFENIRKIEIRKADKCLKVMQN